MWHSYNMLKNDSHPSLFFSSLGKIITLSVKIIDIKTYINLYELTLCMSLTKYHHTVVSSKLCCCVNFAIELLIYPKQLLPSFTWLCKLVGHKILKKSTRNKFWQTNFVSHNNVTVWHKVLAITFQEVICKELKSFYIFNFLISLIIK